MPRFIVSYDLASDPESQPHGPFIDIAALYGWVAWASVSNVKKRLPNTTLVGTFPDRAAAVANLNSALRETGLQIGATVTAPKRILAAYSNASIVSDDPVP